MEPIRHPIASEHLPYFVTAPGQVDQMLLVVAGILLVAILMLGGFYFWLHSLPERVAHRRRRSQMELVAALGLIGLFTHNNAFWVGALILAMVELPVISGPLARIADSLEALAGISPENAEADQGGDLGDPAESPRPGANQETKPRAASSSGAPDQPSKPVEA
ncbi:MAG: hypothetical protein AB8G23_23540 [Myxococcota bacterium]